MNDVGELCLSSCDSLPSVECGGDGGRAVAELNAMDASKGDVESRLRYCESSQGEIGYLTIALCCGAT